MSVNAAAFVQIVVEEGKLDAGNPNPLQFPKPIPNGNVSPNPTPYEMMPRNMSDKRKKTGRYVVEAWA